MILRVSKVAFDTPSINLRAKDFSPLRRIDCNTIIILYIFFFEPIRLFEFDIIVIKYNLCHFERSEKSSKI